MSNTEPTAKKQSKLVIPAMHSLMQYEYFNSLAPITAACFGTKWGKTFSTAAWFAARLWSMPTGTALPHWYVAPIYKQSKIAQRLVMNMLPKERTELIRSENLIRVYKADGSIHSIGEFRSAKNPNDLQGEGIATGVFDEADRASEESWNSFYTTATITQAPIKVISSPVRRGWFYGIHIRGTKKFITDDQRKRLLAGDYSASVDGIVSFNGPTSDNPFINHSVIERAKKNLPEKVFRAYYEAKFPDSGGVVFGDIDPCFLPITQEEPNVNDVYVVGSDLGKRKDYTTVFVWSASRRRVVWREKWKDKNWVDTVKNIIEIGERYNSADIIIDATGLGDPVYDFMENTGTSCHIEGFRFTNQSKIPLVENLVLGFESRDIQIPEEYTDLKEELEYFGFEMTDSGNIRYEAEEGHDDEVFGLALGYHWIVNMVLPGIRILGPKTQKQNLDQGAKLKEEIERMQKEFQNNLREETNYQLARALGDTRNDDDYYDD